MIAGNSFSDGLPESSGSAAKADAAPLEIRLCADAPVFRLSRFRGNVCVERRTAIGQNHELCHYVLFESEASFLQWCDADRVRLSFPLLDSQLRQAGCALFASVSDRSGAIDPRRNG